MIQDEGVLKRLYQTQHPLKKQQSALTSIVSEIEIAPVSNLTLKEFYRYVKASTPLVVHEGCLQWIAMKRWVNNHKYFSTKLMSTYVQKMARKEKYTLTNKEDFDHYYNLVRNRNEDEVLDFTGKTIPSFTNL